MRCHESWYMIVAICCCHRRCRRRRRRRRRSQRLPPPWFVVTRGFPHAFTIHSSLLDTRCRLLVLCCCPVLKISLKKSRNFLYTIHMANVCKRAVTRTVGAWGPDQTEGASSSACWEARRTCQDPSNQRPQKTTSNDRAWAKTKHYKSIFKLFVHSASCM